MNEVIEPCESSHFSFYINTKGVHYPCSFCEGVNEWSEGIDILNCNDFMEDVWNNEKLIKFRNNLADRKNNKNYHCPMFDI